MCELREINGHIQIIIFHVCVIIIMSARGRLVKPEKSEWIVWLKECWEKFISYLPDTFNFTEILEVGLQILNFTFTFILIAILVFQTAHVLNSSEKRYINLRHLLIKWVTLVAILLMSDHVRKHTTHDELFALLCNTFAIFLIYPSKFIKNIHLKYFSFSERKKYDDSQNDPSNYEMTLLTRILTSITVFFLNSSRYIITFVPINHRKRIQESLRGVNMVIVEEKYFWKMYQTNWNSQTSMQNVPTPSENGKSSMLKTSMQLTAKDSIKEKTGLVKNTIRENIIRAKVDEYIQIVFNTIGIQNRRFTRYRNSQLMYNLDTCQLILTGEEDNKSISHVLIQIVMVDDEMIQLICEEEDEPIYIKFKVKKQMELFVNSIDE